ncbi:trigger factor [Candidatus Omnitrophota bacterium]
MKTELKKVDACKRQFTIELSKEIIEQKFEEVYREIGKNANIKGFRPGKVPKDVLIKHHGQLAREEVLKALIPEYYQKALEKENLMPVDMPEIQDIKFTDDLLSFKADFEIIPEIKIKQYKGLKVKRKSAVVTDDDVKKALEYLTKSRGEKEKEAKLDDAFAKGMGYPNVQELKNMVRKQLEISKEQQIKMDVENQIIEQLLKNTPLDVPAVSVKKQLEYMVNQTKSNLAHQGMKQEEIDKKEEDLRSRLKDDAVKSVKIFFILDKIAELEKIAVDKKQDFSQAVIEFLLKEAQWQEGGKDGA